MTQAREMLSMMTLQTPSRSGEQRPFRRYRLRPPSEGCGTVLEMLVAQRDHMRAVHVSPFSVSLEPPARWNVCRHGTPKFRLALGKGEYGRVEAVSKHECVKTFGTDVSFYHELMVCDLIEVARLRSRCPEKSDALMPFVDACIPCKQIYFPRLLCSLNEVSAWGPNSITPLVKGFEGLLDAVVFLNEECGLFHSDISLCNILVKKSESETCCLGKLLLGDMGLATPHTANPQIGLTFVSSEGTPLYQMFVDRGPFMACKDAYKPACVLLRCLRIAAALNWEEVKTDRFPICQAMAKVIDVSCLAYCLLYVIEKILDVTKAEPTDRFFSKCTLTELQPQYFLKCMVPKVVLLEYLTSLWRVEGECLSIGVNSRGVCASEKLSLTEREGFRNWCGQLEARYIRSLYPHSKVLEGREDLRDCLINLLSLDYFSPCGRET
ncbi:tegument serine/threonine protein kinase [Equid gammaherpesvirus 5]|uniref:Tegument serine/threonine protein kinase n=1 Tax=Equid gammaherpesvirus 5 TaxID=10371 RepID=A0A0B4Q6R1_9GAMA|nr:tegument serine/threonine protein kinase [Equid gammaherpesvirus 5]AIU39561.1 tegument serine/threonine protein kinase [Equid gammaherpesvirus 5]APT43389.1 tegument serine/threonine protein kinase [Equid gammaherpesvirus 5]UTK45402.1 tegument serine/threonine protein kinase [Equid gammaherpesvirus 5]UTK45481.1 tegument serine/threonine protein kinase [Equid gammaherpesvirus 5]UTK45560.1 tegument serine/threonine protein kinase [Equid gammaherpesvirus 5]